MFSIYNMPGNGYSKNVHAYVSKNQYEYVKKMAELRQITMSEYLRSLIEKDMGGTVAR